MGHGKVLASGRSLIFSRIDGERIVALPYPERVAAAFEAPQLQALFSCRQITFGIIGKQLRHHAFDSCSRVFDMRANETVPIVAQKQLNPSHIHLHNRGAPALTGFQQYQPHRQSCHAPAFQRGKNPTLRAIQNQRNIGVACLVFDNDTSSTPKFKIMLHAQQIERKSRQTRPIRVVGNHRSRHKNRFTPTCRQSHFHALAVASPSLQRVVDTVIHVFSPAGKHFFPQKYRCIPPASRYFGKRNLTPSAIQS